MSVIEARSLSTVLKTADDPPHNPRDVPQSLQEQLVLYIARVPGSRDVILTTMKPLQKVVTAPDVESCLYYVHLDSEDDEKLLGDTAQGIKHRSLTNFAAQPDQSDGSIIRKPLSTNPQPTQRDRPTPSETVCQNTQDHLKSQEAANQWNAQRLEIRGPRPMQSRLSASGKTHVDQNGSARRWSEQPTPNTTELPPRPGAFHESVDSGDHRANQGNKSYDAHGRRITLQPYWDQTSIAPTNNKFSLTLIRRYDGMQSNVGRITQDSRHNPHGGGQERLRGGSPLMSPNNTTTLDILTPGYSIFGEIASNQRGIQSRRPISGNYAASNSDIKCEEAGKEPATLFRRKLHTFQKRPQQQHRLESNDSYLSSAPLRPIADMNPYSQQSPEGFEVGKLSPNIPSSPIASDARGFVFESPWHGSCEFSTGIAGRSLKCKHVLGSVSEAVSELRFNLPSSKAFASSSKPSASPTSTRESKRSSIFSRHGRTQSASEYPHYQKQSGRVELEDRLDLSLGQERAGGGFGGKQAKLGKLIIENEGLKMLDLVVAANLALWWKVYEKAA